MIIKARDWLIIAIGAIIIIILVIITVYELSPSSNSSKTQSINDVADISEDAVDADYEKLKIILKEFQALYTELLGFKDESDFEKYGFGIGGPYNDWLKRVEKFDKDPDSKLLLKRGIFVGDLEQLGFEYISSNGAETTYTKEMNMMIKQASSIL